MHTHDVVIVGAGPAGLFAAARLASAGLDVAVLEEHVEAGVPVHCTGVLADDAFDEFGLTRQSLLNPLKRARFYAPSGDSIAHETDDVEAVVIDRRAFDQELQQNARAAGARIFTDHRATAIAVENDGVRVATARTRAGRRPHGDSRVRRELRPRPGAWTWSAIRMAAVGATGGRLRRTRATSKCTSVPTSHREGSRGPCPSSAPPAGSSASA